MIRSIHPCNYFYIPKPRWRFYGGHSEVLTFFHRIFSARYGAVWREFMNAAQAEPIPHSPTAEGLRYRFSVADSGRKDMLQPSGESGCDIAYSYNRLCFKAGYIEPLEWEQRFCVVTPNGTFAMTKRQFYDVFSNVTQSASYREGGIYHYPRIPRKALPFRNDDCMG
jgi:hypothetical protein